MATEITARCKQGKLVVSDTMIKVQLGDWREQSMQRSMLVGIDSKLVVPAVFGFGGGVDLVFRGQGTEVIEAGLVQPKIAKKIKAMLGY